MRIKKINDEIEIQYISYSNKVLVLAILFTELLILSRLFKIFYLFGIFHFIISFFWFLMKSEVEIMQLKKTFLILKRKKIFNLYEKKNIL